MPVSPPLATTESGTATLVRPTNTLEFNGADFTVTGSGDKATISLDSTGSGAALTDTQIGFGNASNLLTGSAVFTYTTPSSNPTVTIGDSTLQDAGGNFKLTGKDNLQIATNSTYGSIKFYPATGSTNALEIAYTGKITLNPDGNVNGDVFIEGDTVTDLFHSDASQENIGIGGSPDSGVERLEIVGTGSTNPMMRLRSTEAGASASPHFSLYRNRTGANNDDAGSLEFEWDNANDVKVIGASIYSEIQTATNGAESNRLRFYNMFDGSAKEWMRVSNNTVEFNAFSEAINVKMEGDTAAHVNFYSYAAQDNVGIGAIPDSGVERLHVKGTSVSTDAIVRIQTESTVAQKDNYGPVIELTRTYSDGNGQDGAELARIKFMGEDDAGNVDCYGDIRMETYDAGTGSEDGVMRFYVTVGGTQTEYMRLTSRDAGSPEQKAVVINEGSGDIGFRVESDGVNPALMVNSGTDNVGIGTDPDAGVERLHVKGTGTDTMVKMESTAAGGTAAPDLVMYRSGTRSDGDVAGHFHFSADDSGGVEQVFSDMYVQLDDVTAGTEDASFNFRVIKQANLRNVFRIRQSEVVVNEDSVDCNFRVESDAQVHMFQVDAALNGVAVGRAVVSGGADFQVENGASFLRENPNAYTGNHDITPEQAHGYVLVMDASSAVSRTFTLPEAAAIGMHLKCVNLASSNGMSIAVSGSSSHQINGLGSAGSSSVSTTTKFQTIEFHYVATNVWVATEPAVAA